jgi:hypothetical protein
MAGWKSIKKRRKKKKSEEYKDKADELCGIK